MHQPAGDPDSHALGDAAAPAGPEATATPGFPPEPALRARDLAVAPLRGAGPAGTLRPAVGPAPMCLAEYAAADRAGAAA
ncbi:hypothetical protein [Streptomyces sp. NPDC101393]|uniref:hypothetical protein n=1 Tax=Streptomyces sp. NPDC101393 TaxID=3366141 RepID=UPI00380646D8